MLAKLKGWRTMITSAIFTMLGGIASAPDALQASGISWQSVLSAEIHEHAGAIIAGVAIIVAFLRWITTTPVGSPTPVVPPAPPVITPAVMPGTPGQP